VDNGGTFTDGILINEKGEAITAKVHTTPENLTIGTLECIASLAELSGLRLADLLAQTSTIVLGSTLATNIVATRSGARIGAITTKGYRDRLSFLHVAKADLGGDRKVTSAELFSFRSDYLKPLIRRYLTVDVTERVNYKGDVLVPLDEEDVRKAVVHFKKQGVESIAVMLLFSHICPVHEQRIEEMIREDFPEAYVSFSSVVLPAMG
jgi:N-methylhydantoinase A